MRIVLISDTHGLHQSLRIPDGDLLIHSGDFTMRGRLDEIEDFDQFLSKLSHPRKIVIAGNHEYCFENSPKAARDLLTNATYLQDEACLVNGLMIWGSPWQPDFMNMAFNLGKKADLRKKWEMIPDHTDILVTHTPPLGVLDKINNGNNVGCDLLFERVRQLHCKAHVFGHIHESYGIAQIGGTIFANASTCTKDYRPVNPPICLDL